MLSKPVFAVRVASALFPLALGATALTGAPLNKGQPPALLDARVGANLRLGDDPTELPTTQRAQAEPHLVRNSASPEILLATFQEGRFTDSAALSCGYALSFDGGLTWKRELIPNLATISGGAFSRATDPVAAIGPQGDLYLNTLVFTETPAGRVGDIAVSRSTDSGINWSKPALLPRATNNQSSPDKNWIAVNDFPGTPNQARLVVAWTNFSYNSASVLENNNLLASISDDRGLTWRAPIAITPFGANNQGAQPLFLPNGQLLVIYCTSPSNPQIRLECKRSTDGGLTYPATATVVANVTVWSDPVMRNAAFLPSATVARQSGDVFVVWQGRDAAGTPRIFVNKSGNQGTTWTTPVAVNDTPDGRSVFNPAVAVTPDGRVVTVIFYDKRNATDGANFVDLYAATSLDGAATWGPNLRLSEFTTDVRLAPKTGSGYMLGDYLGLAPSPDPRTPCVAIWCDTRNGDVDPYVVRFSPDLTGYYGWQVARFGLTELNDAAKSGFNADPDADGSPNFLEYLQGTNPRIAESGESLVVSRTSPTTLNAAFAIRRDLAPSATFLAAAEASSPASVFSSQLSANAEASAVPDSGTPPGVAPQAGLVWRSAKIEGAENKAITVVAGARLFAGPFPVRGGITTPALLPLDVGLVETTAHATDSRLINLSTRGIVKTGESQMIVGFVLSGNKSILVRAAGPALANFGVSGALADPRLTLSSQASDLSVSNDNWQQAPVAAALFDRVGAFPFALGSLDSALVLRLGAQSYSAVVAGANNGTGLALVEAYDTDPAPGAPADPRLVNLSTRGEVGAGPLIAGFILGGTQPRRVLLRAVGPSLSQLGVTGALADPVLTLYRGDNQLASNDDWEISRSPAALAATAQRVGAFALNPASLDAALLVTLAPGAYTAVVTSGDGSVGLVLIEVYDAD